MALGSICEFPGNHENISTFQNAIVAPHYLILYLLPIINCQCIPWSRGCALPEQQRCAVSPCRAGQPGCCTFAACPATSKVKRFPFLIKVPATLVSQLWLLKKVRALALPPSCIWRNCCHVQFVSRLVDLERGSL